MRLVYFDGRGLAETSRFLFALANEDYTDFRYPFQVVDWSRREFVREEFERDRDTGVLDHVMRKLPYLETGHGTICQSRAIENYIARLFDMHGQNNYEAACVDAICESVRDVKTDYHAAAKAAVAGRSANSTPTQSKDDWINQTFADKIAELDVLVDSVAGTHAVGNHVSLADVVIYRLVYDFFDNTEAAVDACERRAPRIFAVVQQMHVDERVQRWIARRPATYF